MLETFGTIAALAPVRYAAWLWFAQ